jgi:hypothetical protein
MSTPVTYTSEVTEDDALVELAEILAKIDTDKQIAKLNETTISDNNGGRIYL